MQRLSGEVETTTEEEEDEPTTVSNSDTSEEEEEENENENENEDGNTAHEVTLSLVIDICWNQHTTPELPRGEKTNTAKEIIPIHVIS